MGKQLGRSDLCNLASAGHYMALRIGFAFPMDQENTLPAAWIEHYTRNRLMIVDPVMRWAYSHVGAIRWSEINLDDPRHVFQQAQTFGLRYGAIVSHYDGNSEGKRSFGSFTRSDREFCDIELGLLQAYLMRRHAQLAPPTNVTQAELEALRMVRDGQRIKEIAFAFQITEGAVKQRLRNAKTKLGARTNTQAAAMAGQFGMI